MKIVLTGGPGAGKTTVMEDFKGLLKGLEKNVVSIPETATILNQVLNVPIQLRETGNMLDFQNLVYRYQQLQEESVSKGQEYDGMERIVLCDRGIPDNRAYLHNDEFDFLASNYGDNLLGLANNYDFVIALSSAATLDEGYTLDNNPTRHESKAVAEELNARTLDSWALARNYSIIKASDDFDEKRREAMETLMKVITGNMEKRSIKYDVTDKDIEYLKEGSEVFDLNVTEYVINTEDNPILYLEDIEYNNNHVYHIVNKKVSKYKEKINCEKQLTEEEFNERLSQCQNIEKIITSKEQRFIKDNHLFRIKDYGEYRVLEIESYSAIRDIAIDGLEYIDNYHETNLKNSSSNVLKLSKKKNI